MLPSQNKRAYLFQALLISCQKGSAQRRVSGTIQNTDISIYFLMARCNFCFLNDFTGRKVHILHSKDILCPENINIIFFFYIAQFALNAKLRLLYLFRIHYPHTLTSVHPQSRNTHHRHTFNQSKDNFHFAFVDYSHWKRMIFPFSPQWCNTKQLCKKSQQYSTACIYKM